MKQHIVTAEVVPDKRRVRTDGTYSLKLRITFKGKRKYYATGFEASETDWILMRGNRAKGKFKKIAFELSAIHVDAQKCCEGIKPFSFLKFEKLFFPKDAPIANLQMAFDENLKALRANGQIGTADSYQSACVSLHKFKARLRLEHITPEFLKNYEHWMLGNGKSITTVSIHLRALRAIINMAIEKGLMDIADYPFGKRRFIIAASKNIKKALNIEEIAKIYNHPIESGSVDEMCRDYWIFIYLCNGLNVKDMCLLKYKNIEDDFILFNRAKTINTRRTNPEPIRIALKEDALQTIKKWGQPKISDDTYIFPHLMPGMTLDRQKAVIQLLVHLINEHMKGIAQQIGIFKPITTYYARHSFATILKNSGISTEFISEALGHSSLSTTKSYLAGFERKAIKQTTDILISFKNKLKEDAA